MCDGGERVKGVKEDVCYAAIKDFNIHCHQILNSKFDFFLNYHRAWKQWKPRNNGDAGNLSRDLNIKQGRDGLHMVEFKR